MARDLSAPARPLAAGAAASAPDGMAAGSLRASRWLMLFFVWLAFLISFVDRLTWPSVSAAVSTSLALPVAALGVFVTAFYIGYVASNAAGGFATDLIGPRLMLPAALLPLGVFTFLFGSTTNIGLGLTLQALMGLTAGADYTAGLKLITLKFGRHERGLAIGLFMTASSLGVVVTNAVVPSLLGAIGWENVYRILGVVTAAIGLGCYAVVREDPIGLRPSRTAASFRLLLANRDLFLMTAAGFGALWGTWGFATWASALMVRGAGLTPVRAGAIVALFGVGAVVAKPLVGLISDAIGARRKAPVLACLAAFVASLVIFGSLHEETSFWIVAPMLGVAAFAYSPLMITMVAEVAGAQLAGAATGLTNAVWQLGVVIVPLVVGAVYQFAGSFQAAFATLAAGPLLAFCCMLFVRERRVTEE